MLATLDVGAMDGCINGYCRDGFARSDERCLRDELVSVTRRSTATLPQAPALVGVFTGDSGATRAYAGAACLVIRILFLLCSSAVDIL